MIFIRRISFIIVVFSILMSCSQGNKSLSKVSDCQGILIDDVINLYCLNDINSIPKKITEFENDYVNYNLSDKYLIVNELNGVFVKVYDKETKKIVIEDNGFNLIPISNNNLLKSTYDIDLIATELVSIDENKLKKVDIEVNQGRLLDFYKSNKDNYYVTYLDSMYNLYKNSTIVKEDIYNSKIFLYSNNVCYQESSELLNCEGKKFKIPAKSNIYKILGNIALIYGSSDTIIYNLDKSEILYRSNTIIDIIAIDNNIYIINQEGVKKI